VKEGDEHAARCHNSKKVGGPVKLPSREIVFASAVTLFTACERPPIKPSNDGGQLAGNPGEGGDWGGGGNEGVGGSPGGGSSFGGGATGSAGLAGAGGATGAGGSATGGSGVVRICGTFDQTAGTAILPDILVLLDASGSMNQDIDNTNCDGGSCGPSSKWAQATTAITSVVAQTASTVNWGLKVFPDPDGVRSCEVPTAPTVPVAPNNVDAVNAAIAARTDASGGLDGSGNTPTSAAESRSADYLVGITDNSPKVILLLTDGAPNCMAGSAVDADDSAATVQAVASARGRGVSTIVVGLATAGGPADPVLNDMAMAGGFPRTGATPVYTPVSAIGELAPTLRGLVSTATDCVFAMPPGPVSFIPPWIGVQANGADIPRDTNHQNGWDFTNLSWTSVQVFGPFCDDVRAGRISKVTIVFYCDPT
jgi:hypothetical protein